MATTTFRDISIGILVVIVVILIYVFYHAHHIDQRNNKQADLIVLSLKTHPINTSSDISHIMDKTVEVRKMRKSRRNKILKAFRDGAVRGALGGAVVGGGLPGAIGSAVIWSTVTGMMAGMPVIKQTVHDKFKAV